MEHANGRLKMQWQRLRKIDSVNRQRARVIIRGCLILHNYMLKHDCEVDKATSPRRYAGVLFATTGEILHEPDIPLKQRMLTTWFTFDLSPAI